jgi:hypothetical protein
VGKAMLKWATTGEAGDFDAADDLKRIQKGKALAPVLLVRGDLGKGLPLVVADGYHRICAVCHFDESAPVRCRIVDAQSARNA